MGVFGDLASKIPIVPGLPLTNVIAANKTGNFGETRTIQSSPIDYIIMAIAVYLAFKCKKNGSIDVIQILLAVFCSPCYIVYRLIKPCSNY